MTLASPAPTLPADSWANLATRLFVPLQVTGSRHVTGKMSGASVGGVRVSHLHASGHFGHRTQQSIAENDAGLIVGLVTHGHVRVRQSGREVRLSPGQIALYDAHEEFTAGSLGRFGMALTVIPRAVADLTSTSESGALMRRLDDVAEGELRERVSELHRHGQIEYRDRLLDTLGRVGPRDSHETASQRASDELSLLIDRTINENLSRVEFSVTDLSRIMNVSRRTLYNHFSETDETLAQTVRRRRLSHAALLLSQEHHMTITEVGLTCGFASPSHFARVFGAEFGLSPTQFRQRAT